MEAIVNCSLREDTGTLFSKRLRGSGVIPAVVYGKGKSNILISVKKKELEKSVRAIFGNQIVVLKGDGLSCRAIAKSYDVHPVTSDILHVDFVFATDQISKFNVPLVFANHSMCQAIKFGAILNIVRRYVPVRCKSSDLPQTLEFDVQNCVVGQSIKIHEVKLPVGVECTIRDKNSVVATVIGKKAKAAEAVEEEKKEE